MTQRKKEFNERTEILREDSKGCMSKKRMIKNIAVVCFGVFFLFTAYDGPVMLQSTMNKEGGIGVICQAIDYAAFCISSLLFPKYIIKRFGSKATFVASMLTYIPYIAANYYPHWSLMLPTSILIGLGAATLWGSQATYLNDISVMFAELNLSKKENVRSKRGSNESNMFYSDKNLKETVISLNDFNSERKRHSNRESFTSTNITNNFANEDGYVERSNGIGNLYNSAETVIVDEKSNVDFNVPFKTENIFYDNSQTSPNNSNLAIRKKEIESVTARVFGIHGMSYLICHLSGNMISYFITKSGIDPQNSLSNYTCVCGAEYCNIESNCFTQNVDQISDEIRITLTSVCVALGILSVIIVAVFLDPLDSDSKKATFSLDLLMATFNLAKRLDLVLLIPSSFYIGQAQGFFAGEFNKAFIGCAWGTYHVALVSICYGFFCAVFASSSGWLVKLFNRIPVFTFAAVLNIASNILLLLWSPDPHHPEIFFIFAGMWGAFVGIIWSQLRAFYGVLFKAEEEAAFSAFHVWYALGFCLSFAYSNYFCTSIKIYVLLIISSLGYIGYLFVEKRFASWKNFKSEVGIDEVAKS